ncbi:PD-(D/E)XK nuclease family protein [Kitasatospora sp. NPDC088351]|uniref:PD-(D/E)XK nuclease family protein n=1 Tax=Kitasatospora sp. NPDC088351 TaxID=3155180 RepID=UPI0034246866
MLEMPRWMPWAFRESTRRRALAPIREAFMTHWPIPRGTGGDIRLVRTNLPTARLDPRDCPLKRSSDARPLLAADVRAQESDGELQDFTLKVLMGALDLIEHDRKPVEEVIEQIRHTDGTFGRYRGRRAHPVLVEWSIEAVHRYLAAREADQQARAAAGLPLTLPVRDRWVASKGRRPVDSRGADTYEATAWGRRYAALDGTARDLWLMSFGAAKCDRPQAEKAVAAYVAACGRPATGGWESRYQPVPFEALPYGRGAAPERVRVVEFGCGDGRAVELLDWDRQEARRQFAEQGWPALARALDDTRSQPGSSCVDCKALHGCAALPMSAGLLQIGSAAVLRPRRSVSVTDLRAYAECPAKYHATRQLKLRSAQPESAQVRRGRAVDGWLNERHAVAPHQGCRGLPGPSDPSEWSAEGHRVSGREAEDGAAMLVQHSYVCPLNDLPPSEAVQVQRQVVCYDQELDLVLIATPDLLHTRGGGWVWRETKTTGRRLYEGRSLMASYPQLAFGVLLLAAGALGGDLTRARVELELLHTDDLTLEELDPSRPQVVAEARKVIAGLVRPWVEDRTFAAAPGRACRSCEARDWCVPGRTHLATVEEP